MPGTFVLANKLLSRLVTNCFTWGLLVGLELGDSMQARPLVRTRPMRDKMAKQKVVDENFCSPPKMNKITQVYKNSSPSSSI